MENKTPKVTGHSKIFSCHMNPGNHESVPMCLIYISIFKIKKITEKNVEVQNLSPC